MHVTFIHGIGNKPPEADLLRRWREALADDDGFDLEYEGISSTMAYWADFLYEAPLDPDSFESFEAMEVAGGEDVDIAPLLAAGGDEGGITAALAARIGFTVVATQALPTPSSDVEDSLELLPAPIARRFMKFFVRDVHHYLFNATHSPRPGASYHVQDAIRDHVLGILEEGASKDGPHVVVGHSMGTVIAYDCLNRVSAAPRVDALMTIGSPLGLDEVQHCLKPEWSREDGFPAAKVRGRWINIFDRLDIVAAGDPRLANDYQRAGVAIVEDEQVTNEGRWRHDIAKYFARDETREGLRGLLGLA